MCGIAGVIGPAADEAEARRMIESISHRGPDGIRVERVGDRAVLAHARLSIIDLECGWQPLTAAGSTVIGNGEIYNYLELIEEFDLADKLITGSDFEPLLHLYALEGEQAFTRLRGMYAFCLIGGDGRTWLVRDPFGIKPLYLRVVASERDGFADTTLFASQPSAFLGSPNPDADAAAADLLPLGYLADHSPDEALKWHLSLNPGDIFEVRAGLPDYHRTIRPLAAPFPPAHPRERGDPDLFATPSAAPDIFHLEPAAPRAARKRVWVPAFAGMSGSERTTLERLDAVLEDSVRVHQRSDVPYGLFLSGGIDSAAIATLMARLNTRPVTAYTCGFPEAPGASDERAQAERVARALDLDWRETTFTEADFWRIAPEVAWALDEPTTDYATLPTYKLAEAAKGTLTVVLTGEGGDELFGGYGRYRRALRPGWLGGRSAEPQVVAPYLKDGGAGALDRWRAEATHGRPEGLTVLQQAQWADIATWLPNDLLLKLDRCLMAHGLEGRTPFLDREVAAFAWSLPDHLKVRGRHGKWILRKWLERACPTAQPWARKQGFTVPVAYWIAPRAADLGPRIATVEGVAQVCDVDAVRRVFADPRGRKHWWPLMFYALWWSIHVGGASRAEAMETVAGFA